MEEVLSKCLSPTNFMIKNIIEIEMGYINVNHPDFIGGTNALIGLVNENTDNQQSDLEIAFKNDKNYDKKKNEKEKEKEKEAI